MLPLCSFCHSKSSSNLNLSYLFFPSYKAARACLRTFEVFQIWMYIYLKCKFKSMLPLCSFCHSKSILNLNWSYLFSPSYKAARACLRTFEVFLIKMYIYLKCKVKSMLPLCSFCHSKSSLNLNLSYLFIPSYKAARACLRTFEVFEI